MFETVVITLLVVNAIAINDLKKELKKIKDKNSEEK